MPKPKTVKKPSVPVSEVNEVETPQVAAPTVAQEIPKFKQPELTQTQKNMQIVNQHTILDTNGAKMFTDEDTIYAKLSMTPEEATKFLGGKDPNVYFRNGLCHTTMGKILGTILDENYDEYIAFRKVIRDPNVLLFKHRLHNLYTILLPKYLTEFELDPDGDYVNKYVKQAYSVVAFTGQLGVPSAFEEAFFKRKLDQVKLKIKGDASVRGIQFD